MTIAAHIFLQTLRRIRGAAIADIRRYQAIQLARLIEFAGRMAPAYAAPVAPLIEGDDVALDRFETLPVLTRAALEAGREAFLIRERPEALGPLTDGRPAGTTGSVLAGPVDPDALWADTCVHELLFEDLKLDGRRGLAELVAAETLPAAGARRKGWSFQRANGEVIEADRALPADALTTWLAGDASAAEALRADTATLLRLAQVAVRLPVTGLKTVLAHGTPTRAELATLTAWTAEQGRALGIVLSVPECGAVASLGADGRLRIAEGVAFVEIVDGRGRPVEDGWPGRLVATPLYAFTRPLIRFDTGLKARRLPGSASDIELL